MTHKDPQRQLTATEQAYLDESVESALSMVPVPRELHARLVERVRLEAAGNAPPEVVSMTTGVPIDAHGAPQIASSNSPPAAVTRGVQTWKLAVAAAASLLLVAAAWSWLNRPLNAQHLAGHCAACLDKVRGSAAIWRVQNASNENLFSELSLLRPIEVQAIGDTPPGRFGESCYVWRLLDAKGNLSTLLSFSVTRTLMA